MTALDNLIAAAAAAAVAALAQDGIQLLPDDIQRIKLVLHASIGAGPPLPLEVEQRIIERWSSSHSRSGR